MAVEEEETCDMLSLLWSQPLGDNCLFILLNKGEIRDGGLGDVDL